ncbi:hypothetical protein AgCh_001540 [Apium graveolens]
MEPSATTPLAGENDNKIRAERKVNPRKATHGTGTSKIAKAAAIGKLLVVFDADCRQPICNNAEKFNNEIGLIVRNHGTFSYKDWRLVPEEIRAPLHLNKQEISVLTGSQNLRISELRLSEDKYQKMDIRT